MPRLTSGAMSARGGKREGAGRKPDWLKEKCKELLDKNELLEFLANVAAGRETEERPTKDGDIIRVGASLHDRLHAVEILLERGHGKAVQEMVHSGETIGRFVLVCPGTSQ